MTSLRCAGWLAVAGFLLLVARFWDPVHGFTRFLQLDAAHAAKAMPAFRDSGIFVYQGTGAYDGLLYAQVAYDPTLRDPALHRAVDNLTYRGRRILAPALAWLLAAGRPAWIAQVYSALNVAAWLGLAALLWRILPVTGARSWVAWAGILFSAGAMDCVRLALTDLIGAALLTAAIALSERGRQRNALACAALGGLARETALLGVWGLWDHPRPTARHLLRTLAAGLPLLLWIGYIRWLIGPGDAGFNNFTWPAEGFARKWIASWHALAAQGDKALAVTTLLSVVALTAQAVWLVARASPADRWWRMGAPYLVVLLLLGRAVWADFPGAAFRTLLPLTIAFNVLAARRKAGWGWLIVANLTVGSGLLALRDVPYDPTQAVTMRSGSQTCDVRTGPGWFGAERGGRHRWIWSGGSDATLNFQASPPLSGPVHCQARLRSLSPRTVTISEGDRLLWTGPVGNQISPVEFTVQMREGAAQIVFHTAEPSVPEATGPRARRLAFALYDLKVTLPHAASP